MPSVFQPSRLFRASWITVFGLSVLMFVVSLWVALVGVDPAMFQEQTGVNWSEVSVDSPGLASFLTREVRVAGISHAGLALLAAVVTWVWLRNGDRRAVGVSLIFPLALAATAVVFFAGNVAVLGAFYGLVAAALITALLVAAGQLRSHREVQVG